MGTSSPPGRCSPENYRRTKPKQLPFTTNSEPRKPINQYHMWSLHEAASRQGILLSALHLAPGTKQSTRRLHYPIYNPRFYRHYIYRVVRLKSNAVQEAAEQ
ncbi:unnamed protein product [Ectocarpus sp. 4 AP-2014]